MTTDALIIKGDCLKVMAGLPDGSIHCCVTSPPYWGLRDYGVDGQIGLESTPEAYVARMVEVFREVRRVLRDDGTLWLNLGDSYAAGGTGGSSMKSSLKYGGRVDHPNRAKVKQSVLNSGATSRSAPDGLKPKDLVGIPWRVAFALQADGWWLRQDIIWHKPNPMPESVRDRCTKAHEYVFLLTKSERYYYDADAVSEAGDSANWRSSSRCSKKTGPDRPKSNRNVRHKFRAPNPQPPLRLDGHDEALQRCPLRSDAARSGRAVHISRLS